MGALDHLSICQQRHILLLFEDAEQRCAELARVQGGEGNIQAVAVVLDGWHQCAIFIIYGGLEALGVFFTRDGFDGGLIFVDLAMSLNH
jgi:hypothetical protein